MSEAELDWGVSSGLRRDTAVVTLCTLVSRVSGFGRVLATAAVLGSGLLGDVYQTANMVPNLLFELVAAGVLQAVLLPSFVAARRGGGRPALSEAVAAANGVTMAALGAIAWWTPGGLVAWHAIKTGDAPIWATTWRASQTVPPLPALSSIVSPTTMLIGVPITVRV